MWGYRDRSSVRLEARCPPAAASDARWKCALFRLQIAYGAGCRVDREKIESACTIHSHGFFDLCNSRSRRSEREPVLRSSDQVAAGGVDRNRRSLAHLRV